MRPKNQAKSKAKMHDWIAIEGYAKAVKSKCVKCGVIRYNKSGSIEWSMNGVILDDNPLCKREHDAEFFGEWILVEDRSIYDGWIFQIHTLTHEVKWRDHYRANRISEAEKAQMVEKMINHLKSK